MLNNFKSLEEGLKFFFGFGKFKGNQKEIIQSLLAGNDTFVIMPTGGGKSLCYQLPALLSEGTALIISPLIALMKNQVDSIRGYSQNHSVAHFLNSSLNRSQIKEVRKDIIEGNTKMLYIAPETLTKEENIELFQSVKISFIAVDEAHCISEWGHDFRPDYRNIKTMIENINNKIPIIALTATATPKVQSDIVKNLGMKKLQTFMSSFNRDNLYYEIKPKISKDQTLKSVVQVINEMKGSSGILYFQSRKATEELAQFLNVNGIKAAPYHAGLEAKQRAKTQDDFLKEEINVICATIAFGMGIDKPDVRFVIHYDMPKSIENYYQETGRAGRDGLYSKCVTYYAPSDIHKLEKFLRDKPVAEREMGFQLLSEVMNYAETSACRRLFLLHYFGEKYNAGDCTDMCDNCKYPKEKLALTSEFLEVLLAIKNTEERFNTQILIDFIMGKTSQKIKDYQLNEVKGFGSGKEKDSNLWTTLLNQASLQQLVYKDIESYGTLKLTAKGTQFIENPHPITVALNSTFKEQEAHFEDSKPLPSVLDENLVGMLKDLRKKIAKKYDIPPYVIFQDPSLDDMATQYPASEADMLNITGVNIGKAKKYGKPFLDLINQYVETFSIDRPSDFVIKSVANKSKIKVSIIQSIDRKIPLEDIAHSANLSMDDLLEELYSVVSSGTKVNIDYYLEENIDESTREDIIDYFMEAESDDEELAFQNLKEEDITMEEILLVRIKFLSDMAN
jgi:ATP-dependent DNA helicase RecQ